jgi:6-phosphogluconolactonase
MEGSMNFKIEVFDSATYPVEAAKVIGAHLPAAGSVILTGGTTAERIYPELAELTFVSAGRDDAGQHDLSGSWAGIEVGFSDERCVPPDDEASNFRMASELLLAEAPPKAVHRMHGEDEPSAGAERYHVDIGPLAREGFDLLLLGMGADAHVGALYPGSPALSETEFLCRAVDRPDGMKGLTLTPPAMLGAKKILLLVTGEAKAETVKRALQGNELPNTCPVRLLADHDDVTFLLDPAAASAL